MWLNCHTFYSLKYGSLSVEQLLQLATQHGARTIVVTDINNSTGVLECVRQDKEKKLNLKIIAGIEFRGKEEHNYLYTGIAKNNHGFSFLNEFLTETKASRFLDIQTTGTRQEPLMLLLENSQPTLLATC